MPGGAVRGVLGPLMERDLREVVIANRTPDRARKLAKEFADMGEISGCGFAEVNGPAYDLIVNATSASLQGEMPELPAGLVGEESVCYDMAYGRGDTPFTLWASPGTRHVPPRDGACWWNRPRSRFCCGGGCGPIPNPCCRLWRTPRRPAARSVSAS